MQKQKLRENCNTEATLHSAAPATLATLSYSSHLLSATLLWATLATLLPTTLSYSQRLQLLYSQPLGATLISATLATPLSAALANLLSATLSYSSHLLSATPAIQQNSIFPRSQNVEPATKF